MRISSLTVWSGLVKLMRFTLQIRIIVSVVFKSEWWHLWDQMSNMCTTIMPQPYPSNASWSFSSVQMLLISTCNAFASIFKIKQNIFTLHLTLMHLADLILSIFFLQNNMHWWIWITDAWRKVLRVTVEFILHVFCKQLNAYGSGQKILLIWFYEATWLQNKTTFPVMQPQKMTMHNQHT